MSATERRKTVKARLPKAPFQKLLSIGAAIAGVGILLVQLFVPKEQLSGWTVLHILNMLLLALATICAVGLVLTAFNRPGRNRT